MNIDIKKHIKPLRLNGLPEGMRNELKSARLKRDLSQAKLGRLIGLPQMHISGIESGKIVPRFDTLLELVRVLGYDLILVPRSLVPAVHGLIRDHEQDVNEQPLYASTEQEEEGKNHE